MPDSADTAKDRRNYHLYIHDSFCRSPDQHGVLHRQLQMAKNGGCMGVAGQLSLCKKANNAPYGPIIMTAPRGTQL